MFRLFTLISIFLSMSFAQAKDTFISTPSATQDLMQLCQTIQNEYVYLAYKEQRYDFSWSRRCENFKDKLRGVSFQEKISNAQFALLLTDLVRVFKDAHTRISGRAESRTGLHLGLGIQYLSEGFWLRAGNADIERQTGISEENLDQEKLVVESLQGVPISKLSTILPFVGSNNSQTHNSAAASHLSRPTSGDVFKYLDEWSGFKIPWDNIIRLELKSLKTGDRFSVTYPWLKVSSNSSKNNSKPTTQSCAEREGFTFKKLTGDVYYLRTPTWYPDDDNCLEKIENFLLEKVKFLRSEANSKLIVDARFNGGGASIWESFVRQFIPQQKEAIVTNVISFHKPGFKGYHLNTKGIPHRMVDGVARPLWFTDKCQSVIYTDLTQSEKSLIEVFLQRHPLGHQRFFKSNSYSQPHVCTLKPAAKTYSGKTAVLIDRYGYSSNDQFVTSIKAADPDRITLIGERTRGGSGGGGQVVLKNSQLRLSYAIFANWGHAGALIEDLGTNPDIFVEETMESILNKKDAYIEKALELLTTN